MSLTFELKNIQPENVDTDDKRIIIKSESVVNTSEITIEELNRQLERIDSEMQSLQENRDSLISEINDIIEQVGLTVSTAISEKLVEKIKL